MSPDEEREIQAAVKKIAMLGGVSAEDAETSLRIMMKRLSTPLCESQAEGARRPPGRASSAKTTAAR